MSLRSPKLPVIATLVALLGSMPIGRAAAPAGQYTNNGNGTITDNETGLIWQQGVSPTQYNQAGAVTYCANLVLGGNSNWRLPAINELATIYDACDPTFVDSAYFSAATNVPFWSATVYVNDTTQYWTQLNNTYYRAASLVGNVRCVR